MRIFISTGIYPPEIGGPAEYAKNLASSLKEKGNHIEVSVFSKWNFLPTGIRHIFYFFSIILPVIKTDFVITLDTFSCALPSLVCAKIFRKKIVLRTGGDFLWETYVKRTGDVVLLSDFYKTSLNKLSIKEKIIFSLISFILKNVDAVIWSTEWQKNIFLNPYGLLKQKHFIVENYYGDRLPSISPEIKNFVSATRPLKWKNIETLYEVFSDSEVVSSGAILDNSRAPYDEFLEKIRKSYAVIQVSFGDISPNMILDSIRCEKPFIVTSETGLYNRIKDIAIFVDPKSRDDIKEKILWLSKNENYILQKDKIKNFEFRHSWGDMAQEFLNIYSFIK